MKKQIISSILLIVIVLILGSIEGVLATGQNIDNEEGIVENYIENTNREDNNIQMQGTNTAPTDLVNDINNQLQNLASKQQPKDNRRSVAITIIVIITVALIAALVTWYYMTNQ